MSQYKIIPFILSLILTLTVQKPRSPRWAVDTDNPAPEPQPDSTFRDELLAQTELSSWMYVWLFLTSIPLIGIFCCLYHFRSHVLDLVRQFISVALMRARNCFTFEHVDVDSPVGLECVTYTDSPSVEGQDADRIQVSYDDVSNLVLILLLIIGTGEEPSGIHEQSH